MSNFLAPFFQLFMGKKLFFLDYFLHCSVRTKKLLNKKVEKIQKKFGRIFFGLKTVFFRARCFWFFLVLVHRGSLRGSFLQSPWNSGKTKFGIR